MNFEGVPSNKALEKKPVSSSVEKGLEIEPAEVSVIEETEEQDAREAYEILAKIQSGAGQQPTEEKLAEKLYEFGKRHEARKYNLEDFLSQTEEEILLNKGSSAQEMTIEEIRGLVKTVEDSLQELKPGIFDSLPLSKKNILIRLKKKLETFLRKAAVG